MIVLDLDDTLWRGTVGEIGDIGVVPLPRFQRALKDLKERGVMLAIASRNADHIAWPAVNAAPGMVLQQDDFVARRIDWGDKAANIASIVQELNIGLQSVVFIDDNPSQRGWVHEALPEVLVPEWPVAVDDDVYVAALEALDCFDTSTPTEEDKLRTQMYARERERARSRAPGSSPEEWLASLGTTISIEEITSDSFSRVHQLLNKTNQMNLSTRRLTEDELRTWVSDPSNECYTVKVSDRFGDAGLTGILGVRSCGTTMEIIDFVLSCRVMGRLVEEAMVAHAVKVARERGCCLIKATFLPTPKNAPCLEFWTTRSGFERSDNAFLLEVRP